MPGARVASMLLFGCLACVPPPVDGGTGGGSTARGGAAGGGSGGGGADAGVACTDAPPELVEKVLLNTVAATATKPGVEAWRIKYRSTGGIEVYGQLCVPQTAGPHPIIAYSHGGAGGLGLGDWGARANPDNQCYALASGGAIAVMSQYRGETDRGMSSAGPIDLTSGGSIEVCLGEVDDVAALLELARRRCDAKPDHVVAYGFSHGGCITLQLAARQPSWLRAALPFVAPVDIAELYTFSKPLAADAGSWAALGCSTTTYQGLVSLLEAAIGTPATNPAGYRARSPIFKASQLGAVPLFMVHGLADCAVPYLDHGCAMRHALADAGIVTRNLHVSATGQPQTTPVSGCGPDDWSTDFVAADGGFNSTHVVVAVDGMDHGLTMAGSAPLAGAALFASQYGL